MRLAIILVFLCFVSQTNRDQHRSIHIRTHVVVGLDVDGPAWMLSILYSSSSPLSYTKTHNRMSTRKTHGRSTIHMWNRVLLDCMV